MSNLTKALPSLRFPSISVLWQKISDRNVKQPALDMVHFYPRWNLTFNETWIDTAFIATESSVCYFCCTWTSSGQEAPRRHTYVEKTYPASLSPLLVQVIGVLPTPDFGIEIGRDTVFYLFPVQRFYFLYMLLMVKVEIEKLFFISAQLSIQTVFVTTYFFSLLTDPFRGQFIVNLKIIKFL